MPLDMNSKEPLNKETANHEHSSERRGSKGFWHQMQEAHADDERPSKRQDDGRGCPSRADLE